MKKVLILTLLSLIISSCSQTTFTGRSNMNQPIATTDAKCENLYSDMQILNSAKLNSTTNYLYKNRGKLLAKIYTSPQGDNTDSIIISIKETSLDLDKLNHALTEAPFAPAYFVSCKLNTNFTNFTKPHITSMCDPAGGAPLIVGPEKLERANLDETQGVVVADKPTENSFISIFPTHIPQAQYGLKRADVILLVVRGTGTVIAFADNPYGACRKY